MECFCPACQPCSQLVPGWLSWNTGDRAAPAQGCVLPPPRAVSCHLQSPQQDWLMPRGSDTHEIQALDDISVLLAKLNWDLAAKKDSSQNSCLDPIACRKLFLLNFSVAAQKLLKRAFIGEINTHHWSRDMVQPLSCTLSSLTLLPLVSPLTPWIQTVQLQQAAVSRVQESCCPTFSPSQLHCKILEL